MSYICSVNNNNQNNFIMERISLKKVRFSEALSEETNAFTADVYLDGKKFGYAKNTGQGGCTDVHFYPGKKELFEEAVAYTKTLPQIKPEGYDFELDPTMENIVDELFVDWLEMKQLKKHMTSGIVFKDKNGTIQVLKFTRSLKKIGEIPNGISTIQKEVNRLKEEGAKILSTNLDKRIKV
jgi:hypothetical protein